MKNMKKALAMMLALSTLAIVPAMAEATVTVAAAVEAEDATARESTAVETLFGTDIDEAGAALGLEKTQEQSDEAYLTLYENSDIMLGGRDGVVADISLFSDRYSLFGVKLGMDADEARAMLTARGIAFEKDMITELDMEIIELELSSSEGYFEIGDDNKICNAHLYSDDDPVVEDAHDVDD